MAIIRFTRIRKFDMGCRYLLRNVCNKSTMLSSFLVSVLVDFPLRKASSLGLEGFAVHLLAIHDGGDSGEV